MNNKEKIELIIKVMENNKKLMENAQIDSKYNELLLAEYIGLKTAYDILTDEWYSSELAKIYK